MSANSLAAKAVASGPGGPIPPSFDGHGWLYVVNLTLFTAGFYILLMLAAFLVLELHRNRKQDALFDPVTVWRTTGLLMSIGFCLRCGSEAYNLWAWDPRYVRTTATALTVKRFVDPIAWGLGASGLGLFFVSLRSMVMQLRRRPREVLMRPTFAMLRTPAVIVALSFAAAIGVAATR